MSDQEKRKVIVGSVGILSVCGVVALTGDLVGLWALVLVAMISRNL